MLNIAHFIQKLYISIENGQNHKKMDRYKVYELVERVRKSDRFLLVYDIIMLLAITASIVPLMFLKDHAIFNWIEYITVSVFIIDYILRWITADHKLGKGRWSFLIYPITPMAIIDLLSILPVIGTLNPSFKLFRLTRLFRAFRLFKFMRYSDKLVLLWHVIKKERRILLSVLGICVFYVFFTALIMFNVEPRINPSTGAVTFKGFFDALYWATVTLTTVGYGDLCPVTEFGRFISMISSLVGVAVIALPSGVITASYLEELRNNSNNNTTKLE